MLVPSYYSGWVRAEIVFEQKQILLNCYSLSAHIDCEKFQPFVGMLVNPQHTSKLNYLIQNNLGIFKETDFNEKNTLSLEKFQTYTDNEKVFEDGQITLINNNDVVHENNFFLKDEFVRIDGWLLLENEKELQSIFLIINDKPFLESNNFQILMENIVINNLNYLITPYPIGISDKVEMTKLNLSKFEIGASHHTVGNFALDHNTLKKLNNKFTQGIFSITLDSLWNKWKLPKPENIKIDVDGIEYKIIKGSSKTLKSQELKSILIEINPKRSKDIEILKILKFYKFTYNEKQVNKTIRESGPHEGYAEYIFYKN